MTDQILFGVVIVPAVVGLVQVLKDADLPSGFSPAAAVLLGVLAALAQLYAHDWPWIQAVVVGVALGLSAVGLYSASTSTILPALSKLGHSTQDENPQPPTEQPTTTGT